MSSNRKAGADRAGGATRMGGAGAALFWDESFYWGLLSWRALKKLSLPFTLVDSEDIRAGKLSRFRLLYVPGGWASNKMKALGSDGIREVIEFVKEGGAYAGICGGAGLATSECLGLIKVRRKPLHLRVPSLGGKVLAELSPHPLWDGIKRAGANRVAGANGVAGATFHIWWPSQFVPESMGTGQKVLARFREAAAGAFTSDLDVLDAQEAGFARLESLYGLNLDPAKMLEDPLVLEGKCGKGAVLASLIHFDTPGDRNGEKALKNLWLHYGIKEKTFPISPTRKAAREFVAPLRELISFGERNFLWFKKGPLIRWRRGIRGFEFFTLYEMVKELAGRAGEESFSSGASELGMELDAFSSKAKKLLMLERLALQAGERLSFSEAQSPEIKAMRTELFSDSKSHGGEFKKILDRVDKLLYERLRDF